MASPTSRRAKRKQDVGITAAPGRSRLRVASRGRPPSSSLRRPASRCPAPLCPHRDRSADERLEDGPRVFQPVKRDCLARSLGLTTLSAHIFGVNPHVCCASAAGGDGRGEGARRDARDYGCRGTDADFEDGDVAPGADGGVEPLEQALLRGLVRAVVEPVAATQVLAAALDPARRTSGRRARGRGRGARRRARRRQWRAAAPRSPRRRRSRPARTGTFASRPAPDRFARRRSPSARSSRRRLRSTRRWRRRRRWPRGRAGGRSPAGAGIESACLGSALQCARTARRRPSSARPMASKPLR